MQTFKTILKYIKVIIVFALLLFASSNQKILEAKVSNTNLNKSLDLATMSQYANKITKAQLLNPLEEEKYNLIDYPILNTVEGQLTGYVYNCPLCTGKLACMSTLDLSEGNVTYEDDSYGNVRIVASSKDLPCGSIIQFTSPRIDPDPIIAIVLDRGVNSTTIDLLVETEEFALNNVGRSNLAYNILRYGWEE